MHKYFLLILFITNLYADDVFSKIDADFQLIRENLYYVNSSETKRQAINTLLNSIEDQLYALKQDDPVVKSYIQQVSSIYSSFSMIDPSRICSDKSVGLPKNRPCYKEARSVWQNTASTCVNSNYKKTLEQEDIRACFDEYGFQLLNVYQRFLRNNPDTQGTVAFKLSVAKTGEVTSCEATSSELPSLLVNELTLVIKNMKFPKSDQGWEGPYRLNFDPR